MRAGGVGLVSASDRVMGAGTDAVLPCWPVHMSFLYSCGAIHAHAPQSLLGDIK